jgi:hypothetical protein
MVWIAGQTLTTTTNPVSFISIPSTFTHLQLRYSARTDFSGGFASAYIVFNNDTTANIYRWHNLTGDGSSTTSNTGTNNNITLIHGAFGATSAANLFAPAIVDILDYTNTNKLKTVRAIQGADANGSGSVRLTSGFHTTLTAAINRIDIYWDGLAIAGSRFDLYGITTSQVTGA